MAVLRRKDGAQFVLRPYRETLHLRRAKLLKRELDLLAQANGEYARFFKQGGGRLEAVFAGEPGYLLGEAVWRHFGRPADLIYCEALSTGNEAIIVVVRGGSVYLDAKLSFTELVEELSALTAVKANYTIHVAGKVPLTPVGETDSDFSFEPNMVQSFHYLETGLLDSIAIDSSLQVLPYHQALTELELDKGAKTIAILGWGAVFLAVAIWFWQNEVSQKPVATQKAQEDPYQEYRSTLATPEPAQQLTELATQLGLLTSMPGWFATNINFGGNSSTIQVHSYGSPSKALLEWASANGGNVDFTSNGAVLRLATQAPRRNVTPAMMPMQILLSNLIDGMMSVIPGKSIAIGAITPKVVYQSTGLTITLNNSSPGLLLLISRVISGLPIVLDKCTLTLNNGLLSGTIQLTALGT